MPRRAFTTVRAVPVDAGPLRRALLASRGHLTDAARLLGVSRPTLYDWSHQLGIDLPAEARAAKSASTAAQLDTVTLPLVDYLALVAAASRQTDVTVATEGLIDHLIGKLTDLLAELRRRGVDIAPDGAREVTRG